MARISNRSVIAFFAVVTAILLLTAMLFVGSDGQKNRSFTIEKNNLLALPFTIVLPTTFAYNVDVSGSNASIYLMEYDQLNNLLAGDDFVYMANYSVLNTMHASSSINLTAGKYVLVIVNEADTATGKAINVSVSSSFTATGTGYSWKELVITAVIVALCLVLVVLVLVSFRKVDKKRRKRKGNRKKAKDTAPMCTECNSPLEGSDAFCGRCGHLVR